MVKEVARLFECPRGMCAREGALVVDEMTKAVITTHAPYVPVALTNDELRACADLPGGPDRRFRRVPDART